MVATIAWFLLGNPFGIGNAYVAPVFPLVVMSVCSMMRWMRAGVSEPKGDCPRHLRRLVGLPVVLRPRTKFLV
jgi:hypothetical protein